MISSPDQLSQAFVECAGSAPRWLVRGCGRVNLIGEHTDYNDGWVLPGAINRYLYLGARPNGSSRLRIWALDLDAYGEVDLGAIAPSPTLWLNYCAGIARQFQQAGYTLPGLDVVMGGNLPIGAGVSSSAALETGLATLWNAVAGAGLSGPELARLAQTSSHEFVGVPCGIMDQFASLMGRARQVLLLDCRSLEYELITADTGHYGWLLLNTRVSHSHAASQYPVRVRECQEGLAMLRACYPDLGSLRDLHSDQLEAQRHLLPHQVYRRCAYVVQETARTLAAVQHLRAGRIEALGECLLATHAGLRDDYAVSCPELDFLVDFAASFPGVAGARLMGGGFGGCTLNLVTLTQRDALAEAALAAYQARFGRAGESLTFELVDGTALI